MSRTDEAMLDASAEEKARPSASTRHTVALTRRGEPSRETTLSRTGVPILSRWLVLTLAPKGLMSSDLDKKRLDMGVADLLPHGDFPQQERRQYSPTRVSSSVRFSRHKASHESDTGPAPEADSLTEFWISV